MPEPLHGKKHGVDRSALRSILNAEFDGGSRKSNAATSESILGSGQAAEEDAILRSKMDTVNGGVTLNLQ
jgi:hypothetical protein